MKAVNFWIGMAIFISLVLVAETIVLVNETNTKLLYKEVLILDFKVNALESNGNEFYDLASISYDEMDYPNVIKNCEKARDYFSDEAQEIRELKATINKEKRIFELYKDLLEENIIIKNSLYEACEYLESASRNYDIYYNTDTIESSYYEMGGSNIDSANEKINIHDDAVGRYNDILAEIKVELEEMAK